MTIVPAQQTQAHSVLTIVAAQSPLMLEPNLFSLFDSSAFKAFDCTSTHLIPAPRDCHWNLILNLIVLDLAIMIQILTLMLTMTRRTIQTVARNYTTL